MKIAEQVRRSLPGIIAYCEMQDPAEFDRLCDADWSKAHFGINFPFWQRAEAINPDQHCRYWQAVWQVGGMAVRVTNDWYSRSQPMLATYLMSRGLCHHADVVEEKPSAQPASRTRAGRYRSHAIGNAQNGLIRNILGRLGQEGFDAADWQQVIADFDHCCAYCGGQGPLQQDHVIPINRQSLGEHRLGNLVPCCRSCNATKHGRDFRDFLSAAPDRIARVQAHMARHGYRPMGENPQVQQVFQQAHDELRQMADRYAQMVQTVLADQKGA